MKKINKLLNVLFTLSLLITLCNTVVGCKHDLIPEPSNNGSTTKNPADYDDYITPPVNVQASQGDVRKVTITWDPLPNAVNYLIYSANTPFDEFQKIGEQKETSFISDREDFGVTKYYAVKAVNYYGTESFLSNKVMGSTLGKPIITAIDPDSSGNSVTVHWWMDNCNANTYQSLIHYKVSVYQDANKTPVPDSETLVLESTDESGAAVTSATVENLSPKTDYYFIVDAENITDPSIIESSDLTNQATAHQLIPLAPEELNITQGTNKDAVVLSWKLPGNVDYYDSNTLTYEEHPVYFKLLRKELGADDSKYISIADYIGVDVTRTGSKDYSYDCSTNTTSNNSILTIAKDTASDELTNATYIQYTPNSEITFQDLSAENGKQYTYTLHTYTDFSTKVYEAETISNDGWIISVPDFRVYSSFELLDQNTISTINVSYKLDFQNFDKEYTYVISSTHTSFDVNATPDAPVIQGYYNSLTDLNNAVTRISTENTALFGYYTYKLFIIEKTDEAVSSEPSEAYISTSAIGKVTITSDATSIPKINNFTVADGYTDKFVLSWDISEIRGNCDYEINWITYDSNGNYGEQESEFIDHTSTDITYEGNIATYNHKAASNERRKYSLTANSGLSSTSSLDPIYETLGTAVPVMGEIDYNKITITWNPVQMATEDYIVSAKYIDSTEELAVTNEAIQTTTTITKVDGVYTCVIDKPKGYSDATISGKPIKFTVTAKSSKTSDTTTSKDISVRTLGPASLAITASPVIYTNMIKINWNMDPYAKGYIINRVLYKDNETSDGKFASTYYYDVQNNLILDAGGQAVNDRANVSYKDGIFTLTDIQKDKDPEETSGYQEVQEYIQWGLPFGYVILPVKDTDFFEGSASAPFIFKTALDDGDTQVLESQSIFVYNKLKNIEQITATHGYGLNVKASKSQYANKVHVEWNEPYLENLNPTVYRRKYILDSNGKYTTDNSNWEKAIDTLAAGLTKIDIPVTNNDCGNAYEYAVQYSSENASFVNSYTSEYSSYKYKDDRYTYPDTMVYEESVKGNVQIWEPFNKGYALALDDFKAEYGGAGTTESDDAYYQETLKWNNWDYKLRVLGPDSYTFAVKNKNRSSMTNWNNLISYNGSYTNLNTNTETFVQKITNDNRINIRPIWNTEVIDKKTVKIPNEGYLCVLRDTRHYYSVNLLRSDTKTGNIDVIQGDDDSYYAYREITPQELARCVSIIIADTLYQTGIPTHAWTLADGTDHIPTSLTHGGTNGIFKITHYSWENTCVWQFTGYQHLFGVGLNPSYKTATTSDFTLNCAQESSKVEGINSNTLYHMPANNITVTHKSGLSSMNKTVNFSVGESGTSAKYTLNIKVGSISAVSISNDKTKFEKQFPYDIGIKHISSDETENTNLKTYSTYWWN